MANGETCPNCGAPLTLGTCPGCTEDKSRIVHRDILLLVFISAVALGTFLFTKAMAAKERQVDARVAAFLVPSWPGTS